MVEIPNFGKNNKLIWIGLIGIAVAAGLYLRNRSSSDATANSDGTPDMANVDGSADDAYSSGDVSAIPGTQYGLPGPPGARGPRGKKGKPGNSGHHHRHHKHRHHTPAGGATPRIATQSHMGSATPAASNVRVIQHRPGGVIAKGGRQTNG